jgi:crotonobetainyl-CoA:carnitine CoA-transferase CaiB-like acyl-CoA transferase
LVTISADAPGPLTGITVVDLSAYIAGPYGCSLLADLGAEVIKVEPPTGDTLRQYPSTLPGESRAFLGVNRSKRGITIDLKKPEGLRILLRLLERADVLVHNFRPSVPKRLGIDYESLRQANPQLIYCALTGYGSEGPLKDRAGYDQVLQAITGICTFQGGKGEPEIVFGSVVDFYAAALLAYGVNAALYHRERTGQGQYVGVSLLGSALAMQATRFIWAESEPRNVWRDMRSGGVTGIHPAKEGYIYISANTPHFWQALCELTGLLDLWADPRFETVRQRADNAGLILPRLRQALLQHTALEWEEIFSERVPNAAVRDIEAMFDFDQVLAEDLVTTVEHPELGPYKSLQRPVKFSATPGPAPFSAPLQGEHTDSILKSAGYDAEQIAALRACGAVVP